MSQKAMQSLVQCACFSGGECRYACAGALQSGSRGFLHLLFESGSACQRFCMAWRPCLPRLCALRSQLCVINELAIRFHHAQLRHVLQISLRPPKGPAAQTGGQDMADMPIRTAAACDGVALVTNPYPVAEQVFRQLVLPFALLWCRLPENCPAHRRGLLLFVHAHMVQKVGDLTGPSGPEASERLHGMEAIQDRNAGVQPLLSLAYPGSAVA